ncbi:MAG TPA: 3' terminal RNA ribose 2'-O-methyltransferase Hen1 [Gaiellaceae bacterium]|nr:3' terminal RNA ribose 2'-O-methyltransferase Hen1 [Gaiellaceae bacterium]
MLLTITTTHPPATDLGYLLHKNPSSFQTSRLAFGQAHVFFPEASEERCTAAVLLDVDPVGLVRRPDAGSLGQYVNDRPYVASSLLSVALARLFGTAMGGRSKERPELAATEIPLEATVPVLPARGGQELLGRLFEPLGYEVETRRLPLDETFPSWGESDYYTLTLRGRRRLSELLSHLYVLIPVLDDEKHYWVGDDEVEKLLRRGEEWLPAHPERELIVQRYLKRQRSLTREALAQLADEDRPDPDAAEERHGRQEEVVEERLGLSRQRLATVHETLKQLGARRVLDLGCGEGRLLRLLMDDRSFEEIVGIDVSQRVLQVAARRLQLDRLPLNQQGRVRLFQSSLIYRDRRLSGYDAAALVEVIEHLDPFRLAAFERVVFDHAKPGAVVVTTPNAEYNALFETLPAGELRHADHRFEWRRDQFSHWAEGVADRHGYTVDLRGIGEPDPALGSPTQMAVFSR